ncbi:MAG: hypothetical protein LBQ37_02485 [Elusimicrobiota bacterium]|jgi:hypothetical protein|nr:hypothetical protein [Elusimicrobiota bacterium]
MSVDNMPLDLITPLILQDVFSARLDIRDPQGVSEIVFVEEMPDEGADGTAYTTGDGIYKYYNNGEWEIMPLKVRDNYIKNQIEKYGLFKAEVFLIDFIIAGLNPDDFLNSITAGAESISFTSFNDVLNFYKQRKKDIEDKIAEITGNNTGRAFKIKRYPVGGITERGH